jgi:hypothetical protein
MDENGKLVLAVGLRLIDFRKEFDDGFDMLLLRSAALTKLWSQHLDVIHIVEAELKEFFRVGGQGEGIVLGAGIRKAHHIPDITGLVAGEGGTTGHGELHVREENKTFFGFSANIFDRCHQIFLVFCLASRRTSCEKAVKDEKSPSISHVRDHLCVERMRDAATGSKG